MFEDLMAGVAAVDRAVSDPDRVELLTGLERVKAACAAAQARITVDLAESQEQVAQAWRDQARECADENDFEGWRQAREQARRASVQLPDADRDESGENPDHDADRGVGRGAGSGSGRGGQQRGSRRPGAATGVAAQVGLARRESPSRGARHLATAVALVRRLPRTLAALEAGAISEWRAYLIVRETSILKSAQQSAVDGELFNILGVEGVGGLGDRELVRRVRAITYRLDAASVVNRCRGAETDRRVTLRPAPDCMTYLTAYLPVAQGVAVHAALTKAAATAQAEGDGRSKGQVMADTLVERVTGQATAEAVPVEVQVVITDKALFTNAFDNGDGNSGTPTAGQTPAQVPGYGTVPAAWARDLIRQHANHGNAGDNGRHDNGDVDENRDVVKNGHRGKNGGFGTTGVASDVDEVDARMWLRRLYTHPTDGTLVGMDSTRRVFEGGLRKFLIGRDGTCRTPWCDAPIRHLDHVLDHTAGGVTSAENGQGLCVRCNHVKQLPGWSARTERAGPPGDWRPHTVVTVTPTGHAYRSTAPPVLPGAPPGHESLLERHLETLLAA